ncbi:protein 60A-like [Toxorhynchites rutilus septentrionalis]|uniref:protein 60A-like n=1 Tax=Toxorhynchites rutilus septentrionalis TaxID=329112 RepID=UPI0024783C01|nr:protein 60A-like [Toxorhynchites rutilus septentrionalis]
MFAATITLTYFLLAVPATQGFSTASGFFVDNGMGQMVRDPSRSLGNQLEIEREILDLFGLHERVASDKHNSGSLKKSASQFLLNVYNKFTDQNENDDAQTDDRKRNRQKRSDNYFNRHLFTVADERAIEESDVVMSFLNMGVTELSNNNHRRHNQRLWFDINENGKDCDSLLYASLRIYKNSSIDDWYAIVSGRFITVIVTVVGAWDSEQEEYYQELMIEQTILYNYEGWLEINVTNAMARWMANAIGNNGVYIDAIHTERPAKNVQPQDLGLVLTNKFGRFQPFVVSYCQNHNMVKPSGHERSKRSVKKKQHSRAAKKTMRLKNPFSDRWSQKEKSCQIHTLYVSFRDLNWQEWIIAPNGFEAYFCHGECIFPLNSHLNATNHALIQTLVHLIQPSSVPKPCCAPTKLLPISVLYHVDDTNAILKKYKDMVVKSCGCL